MRLPPLLPDRAASRLGPLSRSPWALVAIAAGPLVLALFGLTHPDALTPATAPHWRAMHVALIPVFPLIGLNLAWLVSGVPGLLAWVVRVAAYVHVVFYAAVDLLAGVGAGLEVLGGQDPFAGPVSTLFTAANRLGAVGVMALLVGSILALGVLWPSLGPRTIVWGVWLLAGAYLFGSHHIYRPWGVTGMLLLAVGFAGLLRARQVGAPRRS